MKQPRSTQLTGVFRCAMPLLVAALCWPRASNAQSVGDDAKAAPPAVVMLRLAAEAETRRQERRIFNELALIVDELDLLFLAPSESRFTSLPLAQQLESLAPMVARYQPFAVLWVTPTGSDELTLQLAVIDTGQVLVKTTPVASSAGGEVAVALTVRELLATAYLFDQRRRIVPLVTPAPRAETQDAQEQVTPSARRGHVSAQVAYGDAASRHRGPAVSRTVAIAADYHFTPPLALTMGLSGDLPRQRTHALARIESQAVTPSLGLAVRWQREHWLVRSAATVAVEWRQVRFHFDNGATGRFRYRHVRYELGPALGWRVSPSVALLVTGQLAWTAERDRFQRASNSQLILATPAATWSVGFGTEITWGSGPNLGKVLPL